MHNPMKNTGLLNFYTEYIDSSGIMHYAVHKYRPSDGWVWSMRDYKFSDLQYNKSYRPTANTVEHKHTESNNQNMPKYKPTEFEAEILRNKEAALVKRPTKFWCVYDKDKKLVAKFTREYDALAYRNQKGKFSVVEEEEFPLARQ